MLRVTALLALILGSLLTLACQSGDDGVGNGTPSDPGGAASGNSGTGGSGNASATGGAGPAGNCAGGEKIPCTLARLPSTGDPAQDCVDRVNQFRKECLCLPPLERWADKEVCTNEQASADSGGGPHSNFGQCSESGQCTCPGWGGGNDAIIGGCLQMMWDEGPGGGHHDIMASTQYKKVACGFFAMPGGKIWANQNYGN